MSRFERLPRHYAEIANLRVGDAQVGSGPAILLLHGLGGTADFWQPLVERLVPHATLICPDLLGFGFSDKPPGRYSLARHTLAMLAVARASGHQQFHAVVSHSAGGVVAIALLASGLIHAERLALVASPYPSPRFPVRQELVTRAWFARLLDNRRLAHIDDTVIRHAVWPIVSRFARVPPYLRGGFAGMLDYSVASFYGTAQELLFATNIDPLLPYLPRVPTLLLYGRADQTIPLTHGQRLHAALPYATFTQTPDGHYGVINERLPTLVSWLISDERNLQAESESADCRKRMNANALRHS